MTSLTSTAQGEVPTARQGRSRAWSAYHARTGACSGEDGMADAILARPRRSRRAPGRPAGPPGDLKDRALDDDTRARARTCPPLTPAATEHSVRPPLKEVQ